VRPILATDPLRQLFDLSSNTSESQLRKISADFHPVGTMCAALPLCLIGECDVWSGD
jgi:hypothetical protein